MFPPPEREDRMRGAPDGAPVVSVVIPAYRRPGRLLECLGALARQTFREPWEVMVVDDGSPEPIASALQHPGRSFGLSLRVHRQDNGGPASARNTAVREARGAFIAFTDDDCRPEPTWLELLMKAGRERDGALVGGTTVNGLPQELFTVTSQFIVDLVYAHFNADPERAYFLASNNLLCRRDRFLEIGGFDAEFPRAGAEDREFCDRWRMRGWPLVWRPEARVVHFHHQTLRSFVDLHLRYGRGAFLYQAKRRERGSGTMSDDLAFHRSLIRDLQSGMRRLPDDLSRWQVLAALGLWQSANAAGFAAEALVAKFRGRESA
jgi:GT2 family glycosyltransferase